MCQRGGKPIQGQVTHAVFIDRFVCADATLEGGWDFLD